MAFGHGRSQGSPRGVTEVAGESYAAGCRILSPTHDSLPSKRERQALALFDLQRQLAKLFRQFVTRLDLQVRELP